MLMIVYKDDKCVAYQYGKLCITSEITSVTLSRGNKTYPAKGWFDHKGKMHILR